MNKNLKLFFLIFFLVLGVSFGDAAAATLASVAEVGDYVTYNPTQTSLDLTSLTGVTQDALNPSATTQWRVLSNDGTTVELVSADSVGNLTLSGADGYVEIIKILRQISDGYQTDNITIGARGLGWNGSSVEEFSQETYPITNNDVNALFGEPYTSTDYEIIAQMSLGMAEGNVTNTDVITLNENSDMLSDIAVWLAARGAQLTFGTYTQGVMEYTLYFSGLTISSGDSSSPLKNVGTLPLQVEGQNLQSNLLYGGPVSSASTGTAGVRPVVTLKADVAFSGSGTQGAPFVIGGTGGGTTPPTSGNKLADVAQVGNYVTYNPTQTSLDLTNLTGVTQDALNPSATTQWRVLSNDGTTVELVSADSVGNLTLGSSSNVSLGRSHYANLVRILKDISMSYVDSEVANGGRGLGSKLGSSVEEITTDITFEYVSNNSILGEPYSDQYYTDDVSALSSMMHSSGNIWLASRSHFYGRSSQDAVFFAARLLSYDGTVGDFLNSNGSFVAPMYGGMVNSGQPMEYVGGEGTAGVRPVVILKADVPFTGSGTVGDPYVIGVTNGGGTTPTPTPTPSPSPSGGITWIWDATGQLSKSIVVSTNGATTIDWGDGSAAQTIAAGLTNETLTHTYTATGTYEVVIADDIVTKLDCNSKKVISLDLSNGRQLTYLNCSSNNLSALNLRRNTALTELYCGSNALTILDLTENTALNKVCCVQGSLKELKISKAHITNFTITNTTTACASISTTNTLHKYATTTIETAPVGIVSKPARDALVNITISEAFTMAKSMLDNPMYGITAEGATILQSHLMKNTEWGAVAYLTNAIGRSPYKNTNSTLTGGSSWNTPEGVKMSSTHNVFGVYDLNGGRSEYVGAHVAGGSGNYNQTFTEVTHAKDIDRYTELSDGMNYKGGALSETGNFSAGKSWNGASMTYNGVAYFERGSSFNGSATDMFYYSSTAGTASNAMSLRPVIIVKKPAEDAVRLADVAKVGDYVEYHPTGAPINLTELTGFSQSALDPTLTTQWRVLSVDKTTGVVELISADSVGSLTLSQELWGDLTEPTIVQAQKNYANAVYILNEISRRYATGVGTGRGLGYNGNAANVEKITTPITADYVIANWDTIGGKDPYSDSYITATNTWKDGAALINSGLTIDTEVWLAVRDVNIDTANNTANFMIRCCTSSGYTNAPYIIVYNSSTNKGYSQNQTLGVRPVVILNANINYEAVGTEGNSWKISGSSDGVNAPYNVTVSFNSNGGSAVSPMNVLSGNVYGTLPMTTKAGYEFDGWYSDNALTIKVTNTSTVVPTASHTLYAKWKEIGAGSPGGGTVTPPPPPTTVTVSFNSNGGSAVTPITVTSGSTYGTLPTPTKSGYMFEGWYKDEGCTIKAMASDVVTSDHTLYANWTSSGYTVTLDRQGGTNGDTSVTATYGSAMPSIAVPNKTYYTFEGYYTETNGGGIQYYNADGSSAINWDKTSDTTLYAKWTGIKYTVAYNKNGGSGTMSNSSHTYGEAKALTANTFTRSNYIFTGWNTQSNGRGTSYADGESVSNLTTTANATITLYAQWTSSKTTFNYTGTVQTYKVPVTGVYFLEVFGAGGSDGVERDEDMTTGRGGSGGASSGYKVLEADATLYVCVGGAGTQTTDDYQPNGGGYNGGGDTINFYDDFGGGGGGATHIATQNGVLSSLSGKKSSILIVAGGGGGGATNGRNGGAGGGTNGESPQDGALGGTQSSGGAGFGQGETGIYWNEKVSSGGGGGGYYGGGGNSVGGGGGGSGYIGGVPSFNRNGVTYSPITNVGNGAAAGSHGSARITFVAL